MSEVLTRGHQPWLRELAMRALVLCGRTILMLLGRLVRFTEPNCAPVLESIFERKERAIFAFWHNRLCFLIYYMAWRFIWRGHRLSVIVSTSWDGELAARVGKGFGADIIRGSTSRMAIAGLVGMLRRGRDGRTNTSLVVTPDGPRGPKYCVQPGVIFLAQKTGMPIVPVTYGVNRARRLRSWDNFVIPAPRARVVVLYGDPLIVPADADEEQREAARSRLQAALIALTDRAETLAKSRRESSR